MTLFRRSLPPARDFLPARGGSSCQDFGFAARRGCRAAAGLVVVGIAIMGCSGAKPLTAEPEPPKVICATVTTKTITDFDEFVGHTEAAETVAVHARVSGFLKTIDFQDGQQVEVDQLLATIEPDEYDAIHTQSLARIELAKSKQDLAASELARAKQLIASSAVSQEEYDEKESMVKQAAAEVTVAEADAARSALDVKYTKIKSPIAGRVDRAIVTPGNMVSGGFGSGTLITQIVSSSPMYANFDVDESSVLRYIRKEQAEGDVVASQKSLREMQLPCFLQLQDEPDFPHAGKLDFLATEVDSQTGTIRMRGTFANESRLLQSGMYVRVRIPTSEPYDAVLIPEIAIGTDQSIKFAFVIDATGHAERRTLGLGKQDGQNRIITTGISAGETVVVRGVQRIRPGMKVRVEMLDTPASTPAEAQPGSDTPAESGDAS